MERQPAEPNCFMRSSRRRVISVSYSPATGAALLAISLGMTESPHLTSYACSCIKRD